MASPNRDSVNVGDGARLDLAVYVASDRQVTLCERTLGAAVGFDARDRQVTLCERTRERSGWI